MLEAQEEHDFSPASKTQGVDFLKVVLRCQENEQHQDSTDCEESCF